MKPIKIAIADYGVGNLHSLIRALRHFKVEVLVSEEAEALDRSDGIILPGVGSFEAGMRGLKIRGLEEKVKEVAAADKPILGICLGAQLMLTEGHEFGIFKGLDIIKGKVVHFPVLENNEKIPHMGWNKIFPPAGGKWPETVLNGVKEGSEVYFVHSYYLSPGDPADILALTEYGGFSFASAVRKGKIYGCQFHPEKSGLIGLKIIENFIKLVYGKN